MTTTQRINLSEITIATPCDVPWSAMQGDERVRHCGQCDQSVYNLIAMHEQTPCLRLYRRRDGTIITQDHCSYLPVKINLPLRGFLPLATALLLAGCGQQPLFSSNPFTHIPQNAVDYTTPQPLGGAPVPAPSEQPANP